MYQNLTIVGNLGQDPELRYTPQGDAVTNFSLATNRTWTGADGEKKSAVTWFRVTVWGKSAEACNQYLAKGRQALVVGTLQADDSGNPRIWTDNSGNPRTSYEVRAQTVQFLGGREDNAPPHQGQQGPGKQAPATGPVSGPVDSIDEIPF